MNHRKKLDTLLAEYRHQRRLEREEREAAAKARAEVKHLEEAQRLTQAVAQAVQLRAHERVAAVVTKCLEAVFDDPYTFTIRFERKRGKTEARFVFTRAGVVIENALDECGGGVIDVAAFALRLACLVLTRPQKRKLVVLDEPFKFVSPDYQHRVKEMLMTVAEEMQVQFLMVTNVPAIACGKVVHLSKGPLSNSPK